ncbi:uncharacterized protein ASPGLDRAFT_46804 [Aspergillus glaucus CBS 516.65]|uniref:Uncharacterized protein n=1 Tax=Aspergillus glaucus CBS 516.65 TaxID=1160497 RepID=A0A1L9VLW3_ASPGL|nr:hypothetical protein ASPGLDRAFT_46804 [Aspergillus glaucus CBS 516.65]OJJ84881.1 hypothetical protein ASPGLDRAFT_46804 [Aspergillus glaucus CBS 516.65]
MQSWCMGVTGHPYDTWMSDSGVFWPSDLLPQALEGATILGYGFNTEVAGGADGPNFLNVQADMLVACLGSHRNINHCARRPLVFICHLVGDLIVKRMLIQCDSTKHPHLAHRRAISISTYGLLFLGTPHTAIDMECFDIPDTFDANSVDNINSLFCEMMASYRIYFFLGDQSPGDE